MEKSAGGSRDAIVRKVRFACGAARFLIAVLAALALVPIVAMACFLAVPVEGVTVSALDGWGAVAGSLARAAIVIAAAYVAQRALRRIGGTGDPFRPENARDLCLVAKIVLAGSVVPGCVGVLVAVALQIGFTGSLVDPATLAAGLLLLAVAKVFEYGCALREMDDQTP